MPKLLAVVGAVTPPGRLHAAVQAAVLFARSLPRVSAVCLGLADYTLSFADGRSPEQFPDDTGRVIEMMAEADALLLASPVYRASFTGALKNLLDLAPVEALCGKPVGIVAMGARSHHYLGVDWHLRAVLAWFGALVAPTSVYLEPCHFTEGDLADVGTRSALFELVTTVLSLTDLPRHRLGPPPLVSAPRPPKG